MDKKAKLKQVKKKMTAKTEVDLTRKMLVFVPKIDSAEDKLSINPPPLPCWIKTIKIKSEQAIIWIKIISAYIYLYSFFDENFTISEKLLALRLAPPTRAPSISFWVTSSLVLPGLTLPP